MKPKRISGRDNPEFKRFLSARSRKDRDLILIDGPKLLDEAVRSRIEIETIAFDETHAFDDVGSTAALVSFAPALMKRLADVETTQGVVALARRPHFDDSWPRDARAFVLVLDGVQDPGNVGTLFRTAEATGVTGILMTIGCADPLGPKALRASAGSAFRVPHIAGLSTDALLSILPKGIAFATTTVEPGAPSLFETTLSFPLALALGSEGSGLDALIDNAATQRVRVPQARPVESLNVAAAGAVLMFEIARRAGILTS